MKMDGSTGGIVHWADPHDMIDMSVSQPDPSQLPTVLVEFGEEAVGFLSWVNHDRVAGAGVSEEIAVLHELAVRQGNDLEIRHQLKPSKSIGLRDP